MLERTDTASRTVTQAKRRKPNSWDQRKLGRILKGRYGNHNLPPGDRDWLLALLLCGFTAERVLADAPWLEPDELPGLWRQARKLSFYDIGALIRLTDAERTHYKASQFWPIDVSREDLEERKRERRNQSKRARYRARKPERLRKTDLRLDAILRMLKDGPRAMPELVRRAHFSSAFRTKVSRKPRWMGSRRRGPPDQREVVRKLVYRTVKQLEAFGVVALRMRKGMRGPVVLVREISCERPTKCSARTGTKNVPLSRRGKLRRLNGLTPLLLHRTLSAFTYRRDHNIFHESHAERAQQWDAAVNSNGQHRAKRRDRLGTARISRWLPLGSSEDRNVLFDASDVVFHPLTFETLSEVVRH